MSNPQDFGDPFPSDSGDVAPPDPTAAFIERDFKVKHPEARGVKPRAPIRDTPNLRPEPPKQDTRIAFAARLVKREREGVWIVVRQDGRKGSVQVPGDDGFYETLKVGDTVTVSMGQVPGVWHLSGPNRQVEMDSIRLTNNAKIQTSNASKTIAFDELIEQTGDEDVFDYNTSSGDEVVIKKKDFNGEYEISLTITVETTKPKEKKRITVITDIRATTNAIEALEGELEIDEWLKEPDWVAKISLGPCY
jgi:hypothetical protein